jgi:acetyl esterase/lipase
LSSRRGLHLAIAGVLGLALLVVVVQQPLLAHIRTVLFLSQELPQSPIRPLHLFSRAPDHQQLHLESQHGRIVADLFVPTGFRAADSASLPGVVLAMGIKVADADRPLLMSFAETLARLGFVVVFPRLEVLDRGISLPEEPTTFVVGVRILQSVPQVDPDRISLLGISIGASTALVAASSPELADDVHAMIFFGGFYDVLDYLVSLASGTMLVDGEPVAWEPDPEAVGHMREILEAKGATHLLGAFNAQSRGEAEQVVRSAPEWELEELRRFSPSARIGGTDARLFVLHDRGDRFVPYVESLKLRDTLREENVEDFLLSNAFQHAQFKSGLSWEALTDLGALYGFVTNALGYLDR